VRRWILLEQPGSWGPDALTQSGLPLEVGHELRKLGRGLGIRVILIRRGVRISGVKRKCYFIRTDHGPSYRADMFLDEPGDLLDMDLASFASGGEVAGATERPDPVFLVCTHGRHDACCSIRGNAVSRVACASPGKDAWECSHIGGDRFAANLVCFPHGIYYGRVGSDDVVGLMDDYEAGKLQLDHYRGRCSYPFAYQAAEYFVRRETDMTAIDGLSLDGASKTDGGLAATFLLADGRRAEVQVRASGSEPQRLTCGAQGPSSIPLYELAALALT
jgi:hypothetical protein